MMAYNDIHGIPQAVHHFAQYYLKPNKTVKKHQQFVSDRLHLIGLFNYRVIALLLPLGAD
ncbi:MAG: hypothetical protein ACJA13_003591 [Paraglaciecola sp.]|jgi:hypothetical protein